MTDSQDKQLTQALPGPGMPIQREYPLAPVMGVGAVLCRQGQVLLIRRGREPLKGRWSLPGGAVEIGETLEEAIAREVLEETGLEVQVLTLVELLERIHRDQNGLVRYHYVLADYLCRVTGGELLAATDAEEACWVPVEQLSSPELNLEPVTRGVIHKALVLL